MFAAKYTKWPRCDAARPSSDEERIRVVSVSAIASFRENELSTPVSNQPISASPQIAAVFTLEAVAILIRNGLIGFATRPLPYIRRRFRPLRTHAPHTITAPKRTREFRENATGGIVSNPPSLLGRWIWSRLSLNAIAIFRKTGYAASRRFHISYPKRSSNRVYF